MRPPLLLISPAQSLRQSGDCCRRVESHELEPEQAKKVRARLAVLAAMGVGGPPKLEQLSADQMAASIAA